MLPRTHCGLLVAVCSLPLFLTACATAPAPADPLAPAIAAAESFQQALVDQNFDAAYALIANDFASTAWRTREDFRVHLVEARDRGHFAPATIAPEPLVGTLNDGAVRIYPVGLRTRAGIAVFDLTLALRGDEWKIVSASLEFY